MIGNPVVKSREKIVLFFDTNSINRRNAATNLSVAGCRPMIANDAKEFLDLLKKQRFDLLIYGIEYHNSVAFENTQNHHTSSILLSQTKIKELACIFSNVSSANILAKNHQGIVNPRDLITTTKKIFRDDIFGVKHYVSYGTESEVYHVRDSELRYEYIDTLRQYCRKHHIRRSITQSVELFCEELLMNAIYDAPRDQSGNELHGHKSRRDRVILKPQDAARMEFACDGEKLVVSVSDPFGAITWHIVQQYLTHCFSGSRIAKLDENGGAGLGLYMCFTAANSFVINVQPDARSEFIGIFDLQTAQRERNRLYSSLHFFSTDDKPQVVMNYRPRVS